MQLTTPAHSLRTRAPAGELEESLVPAEIKVMSDNAELSREAVREFQQAAQSAIAGHGRFAAALSGGNTPRAVFSLLAKEHATDLPWDRIHLFFGDERYVPSDHPESNYHMANEALLSKVAIPAANIQRIRTELDQESAARDYEDRLRAFFGATDQHWPQFDLVLLGLGDDGHTASLFPGTAALVESSRLVVANWVEKFKTFRITLTFPVLNHASAVIFLVSGAGKAEILRDVLDPSGPARFPAQQVQPESGRMLWLADRAAAALLPAQTPQLR
jgi:6-phosphogluconolactonase